MTEAEGKILANAVFFDILLGERKALLMKHSPIGLRTLKTGLAVFLSVLLVRCFVTDDLSVFYAGFGALIAMDRTLSDSLRQAATQVLGVLFGTVLGYFALLLFPDVTPAWVVGVGVILLIFLCDRLRLRFAISLACIIFLSACLDTSDNILRDSIFRVRDTCVGIAVALLLNIFLQPYNNKKRILSLLHRLREQIPVLLQQTVVQEQLPSLHPSVELLRSVDQELSLYRRQRFLRRRSDDDEALLFGCRQLAERMVQELEAICGMDSLGDIATENAEVMRKLGMELPEVPSRKCTRHDTIVMNYHLEKLLTAYRYLGELMEA